MGIASMRKGEKSLFTIKVFYISLYIIDFYVPNFFLNIENVPLVALIMFGL